MHKKINMVVLGILFCSTTAFTAPKVACPSSDFKTFFNAYAESTDIQKAFTPKQIKYSYLEVNEGLGDYDYFSEKLTLKNSSFPLIPNRANRIKNNLKIEIKPVKQKEYATEQAQALVYVPDSGDFRTYWFAKTALNGTCWNLYHIESSEMR